MRIGLVCPYNIFAGGGVQECVFALRAELSRRGHHATIVTPRPRGTNSQAPAGVVFVGHATTISSFHTTAQISASADNESIDAVLAEGKFDILHFHEPWVPLVSRQILARSSCCNIATFHAKLPETMVNRTIERVITPYTKSILKEFQALTAVSPAAAEYVSSLSKAEVEIIPNGVDTKAYRPLRRKPRRPSILFVGRLERRKGLRYLIEAFASFADELPAVRLDIVGSGPDAKKLAQLVPDNLRQRIIFHGYADDATKKQLLRQATVFCSPAPYGESFGIVLLEAMASGTPVVAARNPGYSNVLTGRGSLGLAAARDSQALAERLRLFLEDAKLRDLYHDWELANVGQYDYKNITAMYESLYKRVC